MKTHQKWKESINEKFYFMNTMHYKSRPEIYSANHSIKPVTFLCSAREAKIVQLAGDFNHWYPIAMEQRENGSWQVQIWLPHGHYHYRFLVDGEPTLDAHTTGMVPNQYNEPVSMINVN